MSKKPSISPKPFVDNAAHVQSKDALISYSRKDQGFVRQLSEALKTRGFDAWVDWEGIPLTSKWLAEIESAIEATTTFIFVISPDSIASEICRAEIRHAAKHRKKFIPVVYRDIDVKAAPPELSEWQWLFFRAQDDFEAACDSLFAAITTDLDHVRTHTRLLVRAREWEEGGERLNMVLRGRNLHEALDWLRQCAGKKPEPSHLHERFLAASRQAARTWAGVRAVVAVLFVAAVAAGVIYSRAARQQALVSRHEDYATALNLAEAGLLKQDHGAVVDRLRTLAPQEGESDIREFAWRYLWGLYDSHRSAILVEGPTSIAISPDSRTLAVTDASSLATLWDLETGRLTQRLDDPERRVSQAVFVDGGFRLAIGGREGTRIWDTAGKVASAPTSLGGAGALVPSPDGRLLFALAAGRVDAVAAAQVWNLAAGTRFEWEHIGQRGEITAFAFRPDSRELALAYQLNTVRRFDLTTGRETRLTLAGSPRLSDVCFQATR